MIEVPSAVIMAPSWRRDVDFFSIGTNDLTQYVLAMDRGHPQLAPAGGRAASGGAADDRSDGAAAAEARASGSASAAAWREIPLGAVILIGLGVTELSVSIPSIAAIKARVRSVRHEADAGAGPAGARLRERRGGAGAGAGAGEEALRAG